MANPGNNNKCPVGSCLQQHGCPEAHGKSGLTEAVKTWEERKKSREVSMPATIPEGIRREGY